MTDHDDGVSRRKVLECMTWVGTGVLWTISGGVPHSLGLIDQALAADAKGLTFLQISDSHIGFDKPANPNAKGTLEEAIERIKAIQTKPAFMIYTGDITHLSKEFDRRRRKDHLAGQARGALRAGRARRDRSRDQAVQGTLRPRHQRPRVLQLRCQWRALRRSCQRRHSRGRGMGSLGDEQLEWMEDDLKGRSASTPIVVFAHIPLWTVYPEWGWGTEDSGRALAYMKRFGSVTVLNGHIHQVMQKVEGNVTFTARSTAFPQPAPGTAPSPGPMKVPEDKLRTLLGTASVTFKPGEQRLAIIDTPLQS